METGRSPHLLDLLDELAQLPPAERQSRLSSIPLSEKDRAKLEGWLRHAEHDKDFLKSPPSFVAEVMKMLKDVADERPRTDGFKTLSLQTLQSPSAPPQIPGYEVKEILGRGGMATVWRAIQIGTGQTVAVKVLDPMLLSSPRARSRFERELRLMGKLRHPGIARIYNGGTSGGLCCYAMELIDGQPLDEFVKIHALAQRRLLELMAAVCDAVAYAHQNGVIHRDLKPSNIMVDHDGTPHVLDFGMARALEEAGTDINTTLDGSLAGTPAYMSPEQATSKPTDTRTDVYTLGVILYRLLTGQSPHNLSGSRETVLRKIGESAPPPRPSRIVRAVSSDLEAVVLKAMAADPRGRYATASELGQDLWRYLRGDPIVAKPPRTAYLGRLWLRRNWHGVAIAGTALCLAIAGVIVDSFRVHRQRNAVVVLNHTLDTTNHQLMQQEQRLQLAQNSLERQLADDIVARADAQIGLGNGDAAVGLLVDARSRLRSLGLSTLAAEIRLGFAYRLEPPPISELSYNIKMGGAVTGPTGRVVIEFGDDGPWLLDPRTGQTLARFHMEPGFFRAGFWCAAFSNNERFIAIGSHLGEMKILDAHVGSIIAEITDRAAFHDREGIAVTVSDDGRTVLYCGDFGLRCWRPSGAEPITIFSGQHHSRVKFLRGDERYITVVSAGNGEREIDYCDSAQGQVLKAFRVESAAGHFLAFSRNEARVAVGGRRVQVVDLKSGSIAFEASESHGGEFLSGALSPQGKLLATTDTWPWWTDIAAVDGDRRERRIALPLKKDPHVLPDVGFPDDSTLIYASRRKVGILSCDRDETVTILSKTEATGVSFSDDGRIGIFGTSDGLVKAFDLATGFVFQVCNLGHPIFHTAFSTDGRRVAAESSGFLAIWDLIHGQEIRRFDGRFVGMVFSSDGSHISATATSGFASTMNLASGEVTPFSTMGQFGSLAYSSDSKTLMGCVAAPHPAAPSMIRTWDSLTGSLRGDWAVANGRDLASVAAIAASASKPQQLLCLTDGRVFKRTLGEVAPLMETDPDWITTVAFLPDNRYAVAGGKDDTLRIWDVTAGTEIAVLHGGVQTVKSLAVSPEGNVIAAGDAEGVLVWNITWVKQYEEFETKLEKARMAVQSNPKDWKALNTCGEWLAFRRRWQWALEFFDRAKQAGGSPSHLTLARCHWGLHHRPEAKAEFEKAIAAKEAPEDYLHLCIRGLDPLPDGPP